MNRRQRWLFLILPGLWLLFVLYLDLKYNRFPEVVVGGIKILLALYLVAIIVWVLARGAGWIVVRIRRQT